MSGATDEPDELLSKMHAASNEEEEQISEMLSQQKIEGLSNNENDEIAVCANCGKEGDNLNICNKCKGAKYCNAACKKKHRKQHKKKCERIVAEMHDEALFREPPPEFGDCPICFLRLPSLDSGKRYMSCCGKIICCGCCYADVYDYQGNIIVEEKCPFCRTPPPALEKEAIERRKKRMEVGDLYSFFRMGCYYSHGLSGMPQDSAKAIEFWHKAGKVAYTNIGHAYYNGEGVERDAKKAKHYFELAAIGGDSNARHNLGLTEENSGNYDRALKHHMIAVRGGDTDSVKEIQRMYMNGHATKDQYANALRSHQAYVNEIESDQREQAAAFRDDCSYY